MFGWIKCLLNGHLWNAKGPHDGAYCTRCGIWEYDR